MLTDASGVLNEALGEQVYLKQVTVVVPSFWRDARCHMAITNPPRGIHYQVLPYLLPACLLLTGLPAHFLPPYPTACLSACSPCLSPLPAYQPDGCSLFGPKVEWICV